jgi:hypothetical protein
MASSDVVMISNSVINCARSTADASGASIFFAGRMGRL